MKEGRAEDEAQEMEDALRHNLNSEVLNVGAVQIKVCQHNKRRQDCGIV